MADFIAVIRRAVDGLSDNTPEMRIKVYDRARSAVQRQLDNMKPRPADDVIARQIEKLDEAIATIEREFSGAAAPVVVEPASLPEAVAPPPAPEPEPQASAAPEPAAPEPPAYVAPEPPAPAYAPEPVVERKAEPFVAQRSEPAPVFAPEPEPSRSEAFDPGHGTAVEADVDEPEHVDEPAEIEDETMPPPAAAEPEPAWHQEPAREPLAARDSTPPLERSWEPLSRDTSRDWRQPQAHEPVAEPWTPKVTDNPFHEPAEIFVPKPVTDAPERADDIFAVEKPKPAADLKSWWDDIESKGPAIPAAAPAPARDTSWDSFEAFVGERSTDKAIGTVSPPKPPRGRDGMSIEPQETPAAPARPPLRQEEREGRGKLIAGIAAAVILLGGAGYAGWRFSDTILGFINGPSSSSSQTASKTAPAAGTTAPASTPAATPGKPATPPATPVVTGPQKFTQRLMADGSETDSGNAGEQVASAADTEGKSIAAQNEKPPAQAPAAQQPATAPAAAPADGAQQASAGQQAEPVKMFLYEERLGQASPTAIEGTVTWSVKTDDQNGHKEKMIQGDISVPGRKMSAIFTLRKNNDPTLPASHIIELTFSLPKDFEGRGIENVLRISMKEKEQEQGDALVAVPAKITDYFHMIALNALPEAVKTNIDLLKNRDWMDIPVTYSNGRRALLTLQKGPDGQKVFDEAIASWQTGGTDAVPTPTPAPAQPPANAQ